ncbi:hypothetical protein M433DRAFT_6041 [Acidomyces richmondensis BFW]|nr:MAG: hypothetical protein FE78DRAFT_153460 [Acidomyces sp. 'richmondensis']KYG43750.1 hypothetical protein M433DRAFT_6041 [Acidomyces richmondensis BFW]
MSANGDTTSIEFVTLGMFIIDDIYPPPSSPNQQPQTNVIGGAGTYSAIGARLFSPPPWSKSVGWIVDAGTDFPSELRSVIASWDTGVLMRNRDAPTTRGWNGYGEHDHRAFKYLTEKKRLTAEDLTPNLLRARSIHLICSPTRCIEMVQRIMDRRREAFGPNEPKPTIIWEPVPDLCIPSELDNTLQALAHVDVVSPNHEELLSLFSSAVTEVQESAIEKYASRLLAAGCRYPNSRFAVVVRCGSRGCYVATTRVSKRLPAYHSDPAKVIDPTGGGNGFLGGFAVGLLRTGGDVVEAARMGSVAASFCIEQVGVPELNDQRDGQERWNGENVFTRMAHFKKRTC